ncbi:MAG: iron-sulfur cluster repair di-iron protein [Chitinophagales bacterium]|nr:iron-sulfur cluster repair di-iron protein [Chitinophagales bacterium]
MEILKESIVGEVVANDYKTASVFQEAGIDYCCKGNRKIEDVCTDENVSIDTLLEKLNTVQTDENTSDTDYNTWELDRLATHIQERHHRYVEKAITEIKPLIAKIVEVHGKSHPELTEVQTIFNVMAGELVVHMKKEELILFPNIKKLVKAKNGETTQTALKSVKSPIMMMVHDHDSQAEQSKKLIQITHHFTTPEDGCNTYQVTYAKLHEFMEDLYMHLHLENNILFPKAEILESGVLV